MPFASDAELFATLRKDLYTAVVGDVNLTVEVGVSAIGIHHQSI